LIPTPLYKIYEPQARELNRLSQRINRILNAMKVRGFYDGTMQGLKDLLNADDNTLLPAENVAGLQDGKNLQNSIWMMPLQDLIAVLQQLMVGREQCKQTIYEITGIADIMRGNTRASETATAQQIKDRWGSLRIQDFQGAVQEYVRDSLRIMAELAAEHFSQETFAGMTGLDFATDQEIEQAQKIMQAGQQFQMQMQQQMQMQPPGQPGQPPQQPEVPPQLIQALQQANVILAKPKWTEVLGLLKDDTARRYRIDIETNSTINLDSQENKQNVSEALGALATMYQSFLPAIQSKAMTMPTLKAITLATMRKFSFGREVEESIEGMPDDIQVADPKQVEAAQKDLQKKEQQLAEQEKQLKDRETQLALDEQELKSNQEQFKLKVQVEDKIASLGEGKVQSALDQRAQTDQQITTGIEQMLAEHFQSVEKLVTGTLMKTQKVTSATESKSMQHHQMVMKSIQAMTEAVAALAKATSAPRVTTLTKDNNGSPIAAESRIVLL
jgi:hypothetical protein